jgi:choline dehydrogenase
MYEVPIFHGHSTEYPPCSWDFFVRHYTDDAQQNKDSKALKEIDGKKTIWYPRAGALGGCTAHNAMITVVPQDSDWDNIARLTGDDNWRAEKMRPYFARLENCKYAPRPGTLRSILNSVVSSITSLFRGRGLAIDPGHGHGFDGWLPTSGADPSLLPMLLKDKELGGLLLNSIKSALREDLGDPLVGIEAHLDPNDRRRASSEGVAFTPLAVDKGKRVGPREYLLRVQKDPKYAGNLTIRQRALATRVLFEGTRAVGVEFIDKAHVYRADPQATQEDPSTLPRARVRARREVIIAGGAFNSPQLLKLSGVGPAAELKRWGIPVVADLPGVGENLQDRYEIGVISDFARDFSLLEGGIFLPPDEKNPVPDAMLEQWNKEGTGLYATNGALIAIIKRSRQGLVDPDLFIFGLPGFFKGYYQGYSKELERHHDKFTWAILKARTANTGQVLLASPNPWDRPSINFKNFGDGRRANDPDLDAVVDGIKFVRAMNERLAATGVGNTEELPGPAYDDDAKLREFVRDEAWGHHASCTNKIGGDGDPMAVLDSRFRVRKTQNLRVVDASVFPRIPGYFIVSAIYMISERASDVIIEDARR